MDTLGPVSSKPMTEVQQLRASAWLPTSKGREAEDPIVIPALTASVMGGNHWRDMRTAEMMNFVGYVFGCGEGQRAFMKWYKWIG